MAINKNHLFEEIDGIKCAVVEKDVDELRKDFLRDLLEFNGYTVVVAQAPPPKAPATKTAPAEGEPAPVEATDIPPAPVKYNIGVTDVTFNPTNAIFGRLLKTQTGRVVTLGFWQQNEAVSRDDVPYFSK